MGTGHASIRARTAILKIKSAPNLSNDLKEQKCGQVKKKIFTNVAEKTAVREWAGKHVKVQNMQTAPLT